MSSIKCLRADWNVLCNIKIKEEELVMVVKLNHRAIMLQYCGCANLCTSCLCADSLTLSVLLFLAPAYFFFFFEKSELGYDTALSLVAAWLAPLPLGVGLIPGLGV